MQARLRAFLKSTVPLPVLHGVERLVRRSTRWPPVGLVRFGSLRRLTPISAEWGYDRGQPVDRYFIENFLGKHAGDVRGHVMEVGTDMYTRRFGGDRVTRCDVLHVQERNPGVTILGDLSNGDNIDSDTFDCVIVTQTLQVIYDVSGAVRTIHRILRPGGVALVTVPAISKISRYDMDRWGYYWGFTSRSAARLFQEVFPADRVHVEVFGNLLTAVAFLHGLTAEELRRRELEHHDPDFENLIGVRAEKPREA